MVCAWTSGYVFWLLAWYFCGKLISGSGVSLTLLPIHFFSNVLIWGFVPSLVVSCFGTVSWYLGSLFICEGKQRRRGIGEDVKDWEEWREGETDVEMYWKQNKTKQNKTKKPRTTTNANLPSSTKITTKTCQMFLTNSEDKNNWYKDNTLSVVQIIHTWIWKTEILFVENYNMK